MSIIAVSIMVQRALNCVDPRLVDHGLRVAAVLDAMLEAKGVTDPTQRRAAYLVEQMDKARAQMAKLD